MWTQHTASVFRPFFKNFPPKPSHFRKTLILLCVFHFPVHHVFCVNIQCAPLATEPGITLVILTPMKILQRNLNRSRFVVWEMKRDVSAVRFKFLWNILISGKIIKEMPVSVVSRTPCISLPLTFIVFQLKMWAVEPARSSCKWNVISVRF
jgi:hypothetical protein